MSRPALPSERVYAIRVGDLDGERFVATSASKARYMAFKALREAGYKYDFKSFLSRTVTLHLGVAAERRTDIGQPRHTGKKKAGNLSDGVRHQEFPA
jgi:hypothetical protein